MKTNIDRAAKIARRWLRKNAWVLIKYELENDKKNSFYRRGEKYIKVLRKHYRDRPIERISSLKVYNDYIYNPLRNKYAVGNRAWGEILCCQVVP